MSFIILEFIFTAVFMLMVIQFGKRRKIRQAKRIREYGQSPESHLLHLND